MLQPAAGQCGTLMLCRASSLISCCAVQAASSGTSWHKATQRLGCNHRLPLALHHVVTVSKALQGLAGSRAVSSGAGAPAVRLTRLWVRVTREMDGQTSTRPGVGTPFTHVVAGASPGRACVAFSAVQDPVWMQDACSGRVLRRVCALSLLPDRVFCPSR